MSYLKTHQLNGACQKIRTRDQLIKNEYSGPNWELALGPVYRKVVLYETGEVGEDDPEKAAAFYF